MSVVAVGKNSFLAQSVRQHSRADKWIWLSHREAADAAETFKNATCVVNFAFSPELKNGEYDPGHDIDRTVAKQLPAAAHYIMLSTRMVYGAAKRGRGLSEDDECLPANAYGRNKKIIEENLKRSLPPEKLTILRPSNIFGYEPGRRTFFGTALKNLAENKTIAFDIDPQCVRDFLPAHIFADYLYKIANRPAAGIFNLGCGFGVECGKIASWLIEGYGEGKIVVTDTSRKGEFFLNMEKTLSAYQLNETGEDDIRRACLECGRELRYFSAS